MLKLIRSNLTLVNSFHLEDSINSFHLLNSIAHYLKIFQEGKSKQIDQVSSMRNALAGEPREVA